MSPSEVPPIGGRIREERVRQGITVRGLAREIGVSASLISQIETDKSQPSVSTLYAITTALGISIEDLFTPGSTDHAGSANGPVDGEAGEQTASNHADPQVTDSLQASAAASARALELDRHRRVGPVVHPDNRETLTLETGVVWELLGQVPNVHVDFLMVTYQPGGSSSPSGTLMRHTGTEFGYLISGELILTLGFEEHRLRAGDAISFDSTTPHGYRNESTEPAVGVWFVLERS